jgi:hypothetical protein
MEDNLVKEPSLITGIKNEITIIEAQIYELQTLGSGRKLFHQKGNVFVPVYKIQDLLNLKQQFVLFFI